MSEDELRAMVECALSDLVLHGRHWLPDTYANRVYDAVTARLPGRTLVPLEPKPWDEWVIVDCTDEYIEHGKLEAIAARRKSIRDAEGVELPV